ncbi:MAG TPA: c-type cytochrome, partial [Bacteroidales bacterium]|nr:c-type cytochrome [Bacteroidales bacterium]
WWDLRYLRDQVVTANELHIPVGRQLLLQIESADVIHDWWVPELGRKMDAIPGKSNFLWIEADRPGTFAGSCNEYCGGEHAWMRIRVIAQVPEDFDRWLREQKHPPPVPADSIGEAGARIFLGKACSGCHAIAGTPAQSHIGPELSHVASRETLGAGVLTNTPENMTRWMKDPQKVKPGARMPDFKLNEDELTCLVTYLEGLK